MNIIGIIPARMASSRFPGKPLERILGMPMIGHVYHRCKISPVMNAVYVATYIALAAANGVPLVTIDKKLVAKVPDLTKML